MRLEHIPLIIGAIVALIGLGFIADASMAAAAPPTPERRRRTRTEPSRAGEGVVGVGTLCMAAALFGRDTWRYGTVAVLLGSTLLLIGVILNRAFLKEALLFRGPARRADEWPASSEAKKTGPIHRPGRPAGAAAPGKAPTAPAPRPPGGQAGGPGRSATGSPAGGGAQPPRTPSSVRHPTPPLASRAYRPPDPPAAAPTAPLNAAGPTPGPISPPASPPAPAASASPGSPAASAPGSPRPPMVDRPSHEPPPQQTGPKERRKSPRGKK
jgi:hypothetical protein